MQNSIMSTTIRTAGVGGQIHSFWALNSFSMSFWMVPSTSVQGTLCRSATARYIARMTEAVQLMVIDVVTRPSGMPSKSRSMSASVETDTPSRPTSPRAFGWSASYPIRDGMSKAVDNPVWPCSRRNLKRRFVSSGRPNPANIRMVQRRPRYMVG